MTVSNECKKIVGHGLNTWRGMLTRSRSQGTEVRMTDPTVTHSLADSDVEIIIVLVCQARPCSDELRRGDHFTAAVAIAIRHTALDSWQSFQKNPPIEIRFPSVLGCVFDGQHAEGRTGAVDVLRASAGEGCCRVQSLAHRPRRMFFRLSWPPCGVLM